MDGHVSLVVMPYAGLEHPALGASIVKAALEREGVPCRMHYPIFRFADRLGTDVYNGLSWVRLDMMGEWTFAAAAFPEHRPDEARYFERLAETLPDPRQGPAVARKLREVRELAGAFVDEVASEVVAERPRVVACTSTFDQHCASLALLRRVKALDPSIVTLMGGSNCEGEMGLQTLLSFPWVDFVVSGEGEIVGPALCRRLLEAMAGRGDGAPAASARGASQDAAGSPVEERAGDGGADALQRALAVDIHDLVGVLGPEHRRRGWPGGEPVARARCESLDACPMPDFTDYFEALSRCAEREFIVPGLSMETSRGCWWGQREPCTFCGLNGTGMAYRSKSPERALAEMRHLTSRYGVNRVHVVDNVISPGYFDTLLPELARQESKPSFFYELRATTSREQMRRLKEAGATWVQPGIESLHDAALAHMRKGTKAWMNLRVLKWARELGLGLSWNVLAGFPGEDDAWFAEMAEWLPLVEHLQPPASCLRPIRFERFSPLQVDPERFGLRLRPGWAYEYLYPLPEEALARLAYAFERDGGEEPRGEGYRRLQRALLVWQERARAPLPPMLCMTQEEERTLVFDTRHVALEPRVVLEGMWHRVHRACPEPLRLESIVEAVRGDGLEAEVRGVLEDLVRRRLVLRLGDRYMALALAGDVPPVPRDVEDGFPGGWVIRRAKRGGRAAAPSARAAGASPGLIPSSPGGTAGAPSVPTCAAVFEHGASLPLDCGRVLPGFALAYETWGRLSEGRDNAILVCAPLTADAHAAGRRNGDERAGWWDEAIGPGRMLDTDRFFVICSNALGGWAGSTGPMSEDPERGGPYGSRFPVVTVSDIVRAQTRLMDHLGIECLHAVVGGCFGGQQALTWGIEHPRRVGSVVAIGVTAATSAHTIATFAVMRKMIREDADWMGGDYHGKAFPRRGLSSALAVAIPLWMSREAMERRFGRRLVGREAYGYTLEPEFEVEAYLERVSKAPRVPVDPNGLMGLMRAEEYFDLERQHGSLAEAFRRVRARVLLVSHRSDWRYPPAEMGRLQSALEVVGADSRHVVCDSAVGHAAIRYDVGSFSDVVKAFVEASAGASAGAFAEAPRR